MSESEEEEVMPHSKKDKRLSVERIYQKKTQLEHILLRPDTYIGSIEKLTETMWVMDEQEEKMIQKEITYVPGLYKIFDEILVNASDNKQRDSKMSCIRIDLKPEQNMIRIWNDGKGIPVIHHKVEKMFVPSLIFGHLLTSSNYDDSQKKVTGGRNGYGAKLCNIFSKQFIVETSSKQYKSSFKQTWADNMTKTTEPKISDCKSEDFTAITFYPDLSKFKMDSLDNDCIQLFTRRAYDIAAASKGVKVFLNGKKLSIRNFKDYVDLFIKDKEDDQGNPFKIVHEHINSRWELAITLSNSGFQQVSFVNSIATTKGGRHVDYVVDQLIQKLIVDVKKKSGKSGFQIKPFQIKTHLWVFVNCLIENPTFDSQTKETMTLQNKSFGSTCVLSEKFISNVGKCGVVDSILNWIQFKSQEKLDKTCSVKKHSKLKGIPKLDDANSAGTKSSHLCTLILTEGDSAKSLAVAGLGVIGRDHYGVFPLRGKLLNVRDASHSQIMNNVEINNIIKITGLQYKQKYNSSEDIKQLRYGKLMIMTDQDQDGSHIKGLLINFIHSNWPSLLRHNFVEEFITPIVKVFKGKNEKSFYSLPEFEEWQQATDNWHTWRIKYYKGLGTSSSKEAKEYFTDIARHRINFRYGGDDDDRNILMAFSKHKCDERKDWLTSWMEEKRRRKELGLPELYLYGKDTKAITYNEFINRELVLFSNMDNERSLPCFVDGFKPGQRKILFTCFKRNLTKEIKVAQLAGSVSEMSSYHHGEISLMGTIIGLAQDYVGSNNLNLLVPSGQFGTRLTGGKDAASPRYIFTCLQPLTRLIFHPHDDAILKYLYDDNQKIEPEWYIPIIPMVLVNGAEGIGTGWSTKVLNFSTEEIISNIERMLDDQEPLPMLPSYEGFRGTIQQYDINRYAIHGEIAVIDETTIEITELPVRTWTQNYKDSVLEIMLNGSDEKEKKEKDKKGKEKEKKFTPLITDYKEYHTDKTVRFVVSMTPEKLREAEQIGLYKFFKLSTSSSTHSMMLFDHLGCIKKFETVDQIIKDFYELRLSLYTKRKNYMEGLLAAESLKLENQARFLLEKIEGKMKIENCPKKVLIERLKTAKYDSDPIRAWKETIDKMAALEDSQKQHSDQDEEVESEEATTGADFNYILNMPLWSLTKEKKDDLLKQRDIKQAELKLLRSKSNKFLWREDLEKLKEGLEKLKIEKLKESEESPNKASKASKGGRKNAKGRLVLETIPSSEGIRVVPTTEEFIKKAMDVQQKKTKKTIKDMIKSNGADKPEVPKGPKGEFDSDSDDNMKPLAQRLNTSGVKVSFELGEKPEAKAKAPRVQKQSGEKKASPKKKARGASNSPKKKKMKNPWELASDDSGAGGDSSAEGDSDFRTEGSKVRNSRRVSNNKPKYNLSSSENDDDGEPEFIEVDHGQGNRALQLDNSSNSDSDKEEVVLVEESKPKQRKLGAASTSNTRGGGISGSRVRGAGRGGRGGKSTATTKPKPADNNKSKKKSVFDDSDSAADSQEDDSPDDLIDSPVVVKTAELPRRKAAAAKNYIQSSDEEAELSLTPVGKKRSRPTDDDDDDFSVSDASPPVKKSSKKKNVINSDSDFED